MPRNVCVIGGGINGAGIAWELVRRGYSVTLFEKGRFGGATSSATTKMIHGGLRYLETGDFALVRESLRERAFLLEALPDLVHPLPIAIPVYDDSPRSPFTVRVGLLLYDVFAGRRGIARSRALSRDELIEQNRLRDAGLRGGFLYHDARVDDAALVARVVQCAVRDGLAAREFTEVTQIARDGNAWRISSERSDGTGASRDDTFDLLVNAVGPWMNEHLDRFHLPSNWRITLIRGSHIVLDRPAPSRGTLIQTSDGRVVFVLPWKGKVLVGTTEVPHTGSLDSVEPSADEVRYLENAFNRFFAEPASSKEIVARFAGVRPLIESKANPTSISRESRVEVRDSMVNVFGGKLTTFLALGRSVGRAVDRLAGTRTIPRDPRF